jgi:hypothetical protein
MKFFTRDLYERSQSDDDLGASEAEWESALENYERHLQAIEGERTLYTQEIVFGNGWLLRLRFCDVRVTRAVTVFPIECGAIVPKLGLPIAQSA